MDKAFNVKQAAKVLQLTPKSVRDLTRAGKIPGGKVGKQWRYDPERIKAMLTGGGSGDEDPNPRQAA